MSQLIYSDIERFKAGLLAKRHEILGTLSEIEDEISLAQNTQVGCASMDAADKATTGHTIEEDYELLESEKHILEEIDDALKRIQEGKYGLCQECGGQIPKRRLQAIPWACCCVPCASKVEGEKTFKKTAVKPRRVSTPCSCGEILIVISAIVVSLLQSTFLKGKVA